MNKVTHIFDHLAKREAEERKVALQEHLANLEYAHRARLKAAEIKHRFEPEAFEQRREELERDLQAMKEAYRMAFS